MQTPRLSVLLPAYNEEERIIHCITEALHFFGSLEIPFEIIVVDDGSIDNTYGEALKASQPGVHVFRLTQNQGKGHALKTAFSISTGELILFLDADLDIHPREFLPLFSTLNEKCAHVVIGSKRHPKTKLKYPVLRKALSWGYATWVRTLFGLPVRDTQTGIKLFKSNVLKEVFHLVQTKGFAFDLELLTRIHRCGFIIEDAPVNIVFGSKRGHITPKVIFQMAKDTISILYRTRRSKFFPFG